MAIPGIWPFRVSSEGGFTQANSSRQWAGMSPVCNSSPPRHTQVIRHPLFLDDVGPRLGDWTGLRLECHFVDSSPQMSGWEKSLRGEDSKPSKRTSGKSVSSRGIEREVCRSVAWCAVLWSEPFRYLSPHACVVPASGSRTQRARPIW